MAQHQSGQLAGIDGLADMVRHTGGQASLAVGWQGIGGHCDDRRSNLHLLAQHPGGGVAVHFRHLDVHQDGVVRQRGTPHAGDALLTIAGNLDLCPRMAEEFARDLLVKGVVLHHQEAQTGQRLLGGQVGRGMAIYRHRGPTRGLRYGIKQHRRGDRLDEEAVKGVCFLAQPLSDQLAAMGGDHQDGRQMPRITGTNALDGFPAVHARHDPVHTEDVE